MSQQTALLEDLWKMVKDCFADDYKSEIQEGIDERIFKSKAVKILNSLVSKNKAPYDGLSGKYLRGDLSKNNPVSEDECEHENKSRTNSHFKGKLQSAFICNDCGEVFPELDETLNSPVSKGECSMYERGQNNILWKMKATKRKPTHGSCCTCQTCGHDKDDCICDVEEIKIEIAKRMIEEYLDYVKKFMTFRDADKEALNINKLVYWLDMKGE